MLLSVSLLFAASALTANAHAAFWAKGMYCLAGNNGTDDQNTNAIVQPLYNLTKSDWWFHAVNGCDKVPPTNGDILELPAGGSFQGEMAVNRAFTTLGFDGQHAGDWPAGVAAPVFANVPGGCIQSPQLHTPSEDGAPGTAMAISYVSELEDVTPENLVVFTVRYHTPWKRVVSYDVPANMPACPPGGCMCAWGWVPNHCGQPNMYMTGFKCNVTNPTSSTPLAPAKPAVWCEGNSTACTPGAKQMIFFNQQDGNNIDVNDGTFQADGQPKSPNYNMKLGFADGAQNDIFADPASTPSTSSTAPTSTTSVITSTVTSTSVVYSTVTTMTSFSSSIPTVTTTTRIPGGFFS